VKNFWMWWIQWNSDLEPPDFTSFPNFDTCLYCLIEMPIRAVLNYNQFYVSSNLHFTWFPHQFKGLKWKFAWFFVYNVVFWNMQRTVDTLLVWKIEQHSWMHSLKAMEVGRNYIRSFETGDSCSVMCSKLKINHMGWELKKKRSNRLFDWLKK
jgi:hypothetical protein